MNPYKQDTAQIYDIWGNHIAESIEEALEKKVSLKVAKLYGANLYKANFSEIQAAGAHFRNAYCRDASFYNANVELAGFSGAYLRGATFIGARLEGARFDSADLREAVFRGTLKNVDFSGASLRSTDFRETNLINVNFSGADLRNAFFQNARFTNVDFYKALCEGADFRGSDLKNTEVLKKQTCPTSGSFTAYKKLRGGIIARLKIPAWADRVSPCAGRICRAEFAIVEKLYDTAETKVSSQYCSTFFYEPGKIVKPGNWNSNPLLEIGEGIHFFTTYQEALDW